jgi:outer membrane protein W
MKKIILSLLVAGTITMNAQDMGFAKGNIALNGAASYSSSDNGATTNSKTTEFKFMPSAMYMIQDNIGLRAGIGFNSMSTPSSGVTTNDKSSFGFNLGGNYYFMKGAFSPYLGLGIGYDMGTMKNSASTTETKTNTFGINLMPGVNYFVAKNWAVNATIGNLGYTSTSMTPPGSSTSTSVSDMNIGLDFGALSFGISYVIK